MCSDLVVGCLGNSHDDCKHSESKGFSEGFRGAVHERCTTVQKEAKSDPAKAADLAEERAANRARVGLRRVPPPACMDTALCWMADDTSDYSTRCDRVAHQLELNGHGVASQFVNGIGDRLDGFKVMGAPEAYAAGAAVVDQWRVEGAEPDTCLLTLVVAVASVGDALAVALTKVVLGGN